MTASTNDGTGQARLSALGQGALWLVPAALVGAVSVLTLWGSIILVLVFVTGFLLSLRWLSPLDLLVGLAPVMMFSSVTGSLHVAFSDFFAPVFAVFLAARVPWKSVGQTTRALVRYSSVVVVLLSLSMVVTTLLDPGFLLGPALSNSMKLIVGLGYAILVAAWVGSSTLVEVFRTLRLWTWVASAMALGSILTELDVAPLVPSDGTRSLGFFQDPNLYAGYLLLSLALVLVVEAGTPQRTTVLKLLVLTGGVVATGSRGAVGTLVVIVLVATFRLTARRLRAAFFAVAITGVTILVVLAAGTSSKPMIPALSRLMASSHAVDADPRLGLWARAFSLWESHPLLGVGIGQFGRFSIDVYGISPDTGLGYIAHNSLLSFLAELGVIGFGMAVLGLVWLTLQVNRATALTRDLRRSLNIGLLSLVAEMMTLNLQNVRYVWIYIGIVVGLVGLSKKAARNMTTGPEQAASARPATIGVSPATPRASPGPSRSATTVGSPRGSARWSTNRPPAP